MIYPDNYTQAQTHNPPNYRFINIPKTQQEEYIGGILEPLKKTKPKRTMDKEGTCILHIIIENWETILIFILWFLGGMTRSVSGGDLNLSNEFNNARLVTF